ncbi:MAG: ribosome small subunit-dependent GTPase A [Hyphomicrobium sp.]|nr:ribosome small subunit-dependent GTPase A [Hyphomicrobium sp.]
MLEALGWNDRRAQEFRPYAADGLAPGRLVAEHRTHYQVATEQAERSATITGRFRSEAGQRTDLPGVGDFVALRLSAGDGPSLIEAILPRTSALVRKAAGETRPQLVAANVDYIFIVMSLDGDFNLQRLERYLALAAESGAAPIVVINKADIAHIAAETTDRVADVAPGTPMHIVSARSTGGIAELQRYFDGNRTIALVGSSGAGKSTMTNQLLGQTLQRTQEVRSHDSRGRHTTTHRQLFIRPQGGAIIDTPGMRGLELWEPSKRVETDFDDIDTLAAQCRFRNCRHETEPGCAVRAAIASGDLDAGRLAQFARYTTI